MTGEARPDDSAPESLARRLRRPPAEDFGDLGRGRGYRLSGPERDMLLRWSIDPSSVDYHTAYLGDVRGAVDVDRLRRAVERVRDGHVMLRSSFQMAGGEFAAYDATPIPVRVERFGPGKRSEALAWLHRIRAQPFDLTTAPAFRAAIAALPDGSCLLLLAVHHIATDERSWEIILREVSDGYAGRDASPSGDRVIAANPSWRRAPAVPDPGGSSLEWWKSRLASVSGSDVDSPPGSGSAGEPMTAGARSISRTGIGPAVRAAARQFGANDTAVLLTALARILPRAHGALQVAIAVPVSIRVTAPEWHSVGCFANTVIVGPVPAVGDGVPDVPAVRDALFDAMDHSETPFSEVVSACAPVRRSQRSPLVAVSFGITDETTSRLDLPGASVVSLEIEEPQPKFDLSVHAVRLGDDDYRFDFAYRHDVLDADGVAGVAESFGRALDALLRDATTRSAPKGPPSTPRREPGAQRDPATILARVAQSVKDAPEAQALVGPDDTLCYAELDRAAGALAARIRDRLGAGRSPVAFLFETGSKLVVGMFAAMGLGRPFMVLDQLLPAALHRAMLDAAGAAAIVTDDPTGAHAASHPLPIIPFTTPARQHEASFLATANFDHEQAAYIVFTSGTTGAPRGVRIAHRSLVDYVDGFDVVAAGLPPAASFALVSSPAADLGLTSVFVPLSRGGTSHLVARDVAWNASALADYVQHSRIDVIKMVPTHLRMLMNQHPDRAAEVLPHRLLILAGEACPRALVNDIERLNPSLRVQVHYGPTETTISVLGGSVRACRGTRDGIAPLGSPFPNVQAWIVDADGREVPRGTQGELVIAGDRVALGYTSGDDPSFTSFLRKGGRVRAYMTGDQARETEDGTFLFEGRTDDEIKIDGHRVSTAAVTGSLAAVPGVADVFVSPVGTGLTRHLAAWLVTDRSLDAVRADAQNVLAPWAVPKHFIPVDTLPLNANGKVDRRALIPPTPEAPVSVPPSTATEIRVRDSWLSVLRTDVQSIDSDFFLDLGGDSLRAVLAAREVGSGVSAVSLFAHPTVRKLAAYIDREAAGAGRARIHRLSSRSVAVDRMLCVPYAGGTGAEYAPLATALRDRVNILTVSVDRSAPLTLTQIARGVVEDFDDAGATVYVYGHSMGAALASELAGQLLGTLRTRFGGVILGGFYPPDGRGGRADTALVEPRDLPWHRTAAAAQIAHDAEVDTLRGHEWFAARERLHPGSALACRALVILGTDDERASSMNEARNSWGRFFARPEVVRLDGADHFFVESHAEQLARVLRTWMNRDEASL